MILIIDNYDSFTFNLYQYLGELGEEITVHRNDKINIEEIRNLAPECIVLSPGPGRPENAGRCIEIIKEFYDKIPILGVCLGHQAIGYAFGAVITQAKHIMHGKTSNLTHSGNYLFQYLPMPLEVMRYHSLVIDKSSLPNELSALAFSMDDQELMAIKHAKFPVYGLQFHPESVGTTEGKQMLLNFLTEIRRDTGNENLLTTIG
jgi:anthranilate synthase component II